MRESFADEAQVFHQGERDDLRPHCRHHHLRLRRPDDPQPLHLLQDQKRELREHEVVVAGM